MRVIVDLKLMSHSGPPYTGNTTVSWAADFLYWTNNSRSNTVAYTAYLPHITCFYNVCTGPLCVWLSAHRCIHVCRWSHEKSTAVVALISGVILSFSPQGHVAETECLVRPQHAGTQRAAQARCIHARLGHTVWKMVSAKCKPSSFSNPTPLISPHSFLFSRIRSALIAASSSIYLPAAG